MATQTQTPKKATTRKRPTVADKASAGQPAATKTKRQVTQAISPEELHRMICEAAYHIAEQRSFQGDMAMDDWLRAEAEVGAWFAARH